MHNHAVGNVVYFRGVAVCALHDIVLHGCLLILIQQWLMFIHVHMYEFNECSFLRGSHSLRLGRLPQAWRKVTAAYHRVDDLTPAG